MTSGEYMERLLPQYEAAFDLYRPYSIGGDTCEAYGYFCSHSEKYVLSREAKLWEADSFEHILFYSERRIDGSVLTRAVNILENVLEPEKVCCGGKNPEKNHMYSYLTCVLISEEKIDDGTVRRIRQYRFRKNYLFSLRGYSEGRIVAVDLANQKVFTNRAGKPMKKLYTGLLR